jgi:DNA-binding transcriptional MocR family regulator
MRRSPVTVLSPDVLAAQGAEAGATYARLAAKGLKLDMTRGKPSPEQLDLAEGMLALPGNRDFVTEAGEDARNYGGLQGLAEARRLFGAMLGVPAEAVVVNENSSLAVMHDCIVWALLKGVPGGAPWVRQEIAFLCPVPGYDRHFGLCEGFGIRLIPVPMDEDGPVVTEAERLAADPAVKGMWCVPSYSNPSGVTYSDATVQRLAGLKTAAPDFRLFWDNAYGVHHLTENRPAPHDILGLTAAAGHEDRAFIFASTSKITLAGAGLAFFAGPRRMSHGTWSRRVGGRSGRTS